MCEKTPFFEKNRRLPQTRNRLLHHHVMLFFIDQASSTIPLLSFPSPLHPSSAPHLHHFPQSCRAIERRCYPRVVRSQLHVTRAAAQLQNARTGCNFVVGHYPLRKGLPVGRVFFVNRNARVQVLCRLVLLFDVIHVSSFLLRLVHAV